MSIEDVGNCSTSIEVEGGFLSKGLSLFIGEIPLSEKILWQWYFT